VAFKQLHNFFKSSAVDRDLQRVAQAGKLLRT